MRNPWWRYSVMKRARELRGELGLGDRGPIADLFLTVRDVVGLEVVVIGMDEGCAGAYVPHALGPVVFVNIDHAPVRQRFTLAHELGHHHLHEGDEVDEVADLGNVTDPREGEANFFAAEFLAPRPALEAFVARERSHGLERIVRLGGKFGLSASAALYRLSTWGLLTAKEPIDRLKREIDEGMHLELRDHLGLADLDDTLGRGEAPLPGRVAACLAPRS
ncbi:MAG: ImmA/IrrE family metallo-endopeptidase [Actinomycetota bacterium]|nr:ImmA/IrrE family metallo-endopeptidase [Actinomycetota bacterium]